MVASETMNRSNAKAELFSTTDMCRDKLCRRELAAHSAPSGHIPLGIPLLCTPSPRLLFALSLLSSFSFLLVVPVFSISLSRHRFIWLDPYIAHQRMESYVSAGE
jgi:hypothetical protein